MNWYNNYKLAQQYPPISIYFYNKENGDLEISFNGGKPYVYPNVNYDTYNYLKDLLKHKNYKKVEEYLKNISKNNLTDKEDKELMLNQLYEEGYLR